MNKKNIKALFKYLKGFRYLLVLSLIFMFIELLLTFVSPLILSVTIDSVLGDEPLNVPGYFAWFIQAIGGIETLRPNLWIMGVLMVVLQAARGLLTFVRAYANNKASESTMKRLRDKFYSHVQNLPYLYHVSAQTGDLIQRATNDVDTIRRFVSGTLLEFARTILLFIIGIFVMADLHVPLTLISLSMAPFIVGTSLIYFKKIQKLFMQVEHADSDVFTVVQENLTGTRVVHAFGRQRFELDKFKVVNSKLKDEIVNLNNKFADLWAMLDLISGAQISLVAVLGIYYAVTGSLTLGQFTAFTSYVYIFLWPLRGFGRVLSDFGRSLIAIGRIEEVLDEEEETDPHVGLEPELNKDIVFKDVDFSYDDNHVLKKLNMTIKGGQTVAILGGTGSGKSTLIHLLQRLYDYQGGSITIGGVDINDIKKDYLRSKVGIVLQEPFLYSKTILQNIGIKMEIPDPRVVEEAARVASIHDDINNFEKGYDTVVGERGVTLSGGQKQRVAIARALVNESSVLVFDDSLSAVDSKTDAKIRDALKLKREGTTTIIISHRLTTLMEADKIFVLKGGTVAEEGTHEELMSLDGIYKNTYDIQSSQVK